VGTPVVGLVAVAAIGGLTAGVVVAGFVGVAVTVVVGGGAVGFTETGALA
jgi:hypothetical protein